MRSQMQNKPASFVGLNVVIRASVLAVGMCALGSALLLAQTTYNYVQIDGPRSTFTEARGLNDNGEVVGEFNTTSNKGVTTTTGFLYNAAGRLVTFIPRGVDFIQAVGVNNSQQIVGAYRDTANVWHGYLYKKGKFTSLDPAGSTLTFVWGINEAGEAVGTFQDAATPSTHGFVYTGSSFLTLNDPSVTPSGFTAAFGINGLGDVAGLFSNGVTHGYTNIGGNYATIDPPGSIETHALGINASDAVAGFFYDSVNTTHGFLYRPGIGYTIIDPPGSTFTTADGINDAGQVVGYYTDGAGKYHGFVYTNGSYATLDPPGATGALTLANAINSSGQVAGEFRDAAGVTHGFLATPQ
jgi:probable HAF family extracellular repeat protein